jgi:hypothetical protein
LRGGFEYGHEMVVGGRKGKGKSKGRVQAVNQGAGFIRVSYESSEGAAVAAIEAELAKALNEAASEYEAAG